MSEQRITIDPKGVVTRETPDGPQILTDEQAASLAAPGFMPRRGDAVEAWLKACRDDYSQAHDTEWDVIDQLLDTYRLHADTGTPLHEHVCEGGNRDDCAGCHDAAVRDA